MPLRRFVLVLTALALLVACSAETSSIPVGGLARALKLGTFELLAAPGGSGDALNLDLGPDGNFYYASYGPHGSIGTTIVQFQPNGTSQVFPIPQGAEYGINATNIVNGPDGRLWFGTYSCIIDAMTTNGVFQQYTINPNLSCTITLGSAVGNDIWLTYSDGLHDTASVGYIDTADGSVTLHPVSSISNGIREITLGPDGNFWFAFDQYVGRIAPSGHHVHLFPISGVVVSDVLSGPDGAIWFCGDGSGSVVGRMSTSGRVKSEVNVAGTTYQMTIGSDNKVWVTYATDSGAGLSRFTSSTRSKAYTIPHDPDYIPSGITAGPDSNMWFYTYGRGSAYDDEGMGKFTFSQLPKVKR